MRIAVVGTGISGLAAAWMLNRDHEIVVFEQDGRIGGHSNTVDVQVGGCRSVPVDTGFIVYNEATYPNLTKLFGHLGVATEPSEMSFSVSIDDGRLEYAGSDSLLGLFAQKRNFLRPRFWGMLRDILRFYREAPAVVAQEAGDGPTLGRLLAEGGYGRAFIEDHLLPMGAAIWSTPVDRMLDFPAESFVRFFQNHGLLTVTGRPVWRTVTGGSRRYVDRLSAGYRQRIRTGCAVIGVRRETDGVSIAHGNGGEERFDQVVFATHADQALALLTDASPEERRLLGAFHYRSNLAVLHRDPALMPRRRRAWASWNYLADGQRGGGAPVALTYWMNRLQNIDPASPLFVTLNPPLGPAPQTVLGSFAYDHPIFDAEAMAAQASLPNIQGWNRTWFCGSWCGYGFHEDGLTSGLAVAEALGARRPWSVTEASPAAAFATPRDSSRKAC